MQKKEEKFTISDDLPSSKDPELEKFRYLLKSLTDEYINKFDKIQKEKRQDHIPVNIFSHKLSPLETVVKYLRENLEFSNKKIAKLLQRSEKTTWQAYKNSKKKSTILFEYKTSQYNIPLSIFEGRKLSILEIVVSYLLENFDLNYHKAALLLNRDERTIWTVYKRVRDKRK